MASKAARRFRPRWLPTLAAALLVPLFIAAGQWQWDKAAAKAARQQQLETRAGEPAVQIPAEPGDAQALHYRRIVARGYYEPQHQILIDNRTYHQQAGFHVVTPLRVEGSEVRLLVNRGWIPALAEHSREPEIVTPSGIVEVSGIAIIPGAAHARPDPCRAGGAGAEARPGAAHVWVGRHRAAREFARANWPGTRRRGRW